MTEPDVTLTDFALALESAAFGFILWRRCKLTCRLACWLSLYFATAAVASFCGGLVHGYFLDVTTFGHAVLWPATLLAIGANALAAWAFGVGVLGSRLVMRWSAACALPAVAIYAAAVLSGVDAFRMAIGIALPAAIFLLWALAVVHWRDRRPGAIPAAAGVATTLVAVLIQQLGIGFHPVYFSHNATAHVVQAVALGLIFIGGVRLLDSTVADSNGSVTCHHDASF